MGSNRQYESGFKARLALELISGGKSIVELSAEYNVPQTNLHDWREKILNNAADIFLSEAEKNKQLKLREQEINKLHKLIGEITVENDFLKKKLSPYLVRKD